MLHGSCVSERPACSRSAGGLAVSAAVPGAAEQVTSLALKNDPRRRVLHALQFLNTAGWSTVQHSVAIVQPRVVGLRPLTNWVLLFGFQSTVKSFIKID